MDLIEMAANVRKKNEEVLAAYMATMLNNRRDTKASGVLNLHQPTNQEIYQSISTMPGNNVVDLYRHQ